MHLRFIDLCLFSLVQGEPRSEDEEVGQRTHVHDTAPSDRGSFGRSGLLSTYVHEHAVKRMTTRDRQGAAALVEEDKREIVKNYKGFVAGVFSGIAKLTG